MRPLHCGGSEGHRPNQKASLLLCRLQPHFHTRELSKGRSPSPQSSAVGLRKFITSVRHTPLLPFTPVPCTCMAPSRLSFSCFYHLSAMNSFRHKYRYPVRAYYHSSVPATGFPRPRATRKGHQKGFQLRVRYTPASYLHCAQQNESTSSTQLCPQNSFCAPTLLPLSLPPRTQSSTC